MSYKYRKSILDVNWSELVADFIYGPPTSYQKIFRMIEPLIDNLVLVLHAQMLLFTFIKSQKKVRLFQHFGFGSFSVVVLDF